MADIDLLPFNYPFPGICGLKESTPANWKLFQHLEKFQSASYAMNSLILHICDDKKQHIVSETAKKALQLRNDIEATINSSGWDQLLIYYGFRLLNYFQIIYEIEKSCFSEHTEILEGMKENLEHQKKYAELNDVTEKTIAENEKAYNTLHENHEIIKSLFVKSKYQQFNFTSLRKKIIQAIGALSKIAPGSIEPLALFIYNNLQQFELKLIVNGNKVFTNNYDISESTLEQYLYQNKTTKTDAENFILEHLETVSKLYRFSFNNPFLQH